MWHFLYFVSYCLTLTFSISVLVRMWAQFAPFRLARAGSLANHLWNELKYAYLVAEILNPVLRCIAHHDRADFWDALSMLLGVAYWYWFRRYFDDDDRWERRKRKLTEKVEQVGGRLVVVPARG